MWENQYRKKRNTPTFLRIDYLKGLQQKCTKLSFSIVRDFQDVERSWHGLLRIFSLFATPANCPPSLNLQIFGFEWRHVTVGSPRSPCGFPDIISVIPLGGPRCFLRLFHYRPSWSLCTLLCFKTQQTSVELELKSLSHRIQIKISGVVMISYMN